jgi:hypothetical protein
MLPGSGTVNQPESRLIKVKKNFTGSSRLRSALARQGVGGIEMVEEEVRNGKGVQCLMSNVGTRMAG